MNLPSGEVILVEQVIVDIIRRGMALDKQAVWIRDTNRTIPNDKGIYVTVGLSPMGSSTIGQDSYLVYKTVGSNTIASEIQEAVQNETLEVRFFSRDETLVSRRWEIMAALNSQFSKQIQEKLNFKIFKQPKSFVNASAAEGGSNIIRYDTAFACHVPYRKETVIPEFDYYDDFKTRVDDEKTIGTTKPVIQFEID